VGSTADLNRELMGPDPRSNLACGSRIIAVIKDCRKIVSGFMEFHGPRADYWKRREHGAELISSSLPLPFLSPR
jgi:hypothetical protein